MTNPVLQMLIERLLWPIPRVRLEAARGLARLIQEDDREIAKTLVGWIRTRRLESEVILGLGIIDAFELGSYFDFHYLSRAIIAPSLLSDFLLRRNFPDAQDLNPLRYARSPSQSAPLLQHEKNWFERYRETAVPRLFSHDLLSLQKSTGFPFMNGWQHDWSWLQSTNPRPEVESPYFFTDMNRKRVDHFSCGQRELYVSAYLRTLGFAAYLRAISQDVAESYALNALTMNRGLARLEPIERPDWARNLIPSDVNHTRGIAQNLWARAESTIRPDEKLLALRVVDFEEDGFVEIDMAITIGPTGFEKGPPEAERLDNIEVNIIPSEMAGQVGRKAGSRILSIACPYQMTQLVYPKALGSLHIETALQIRLASPYMFGTSAIIQCDSSEIQLMSGGDVFSRWAHWYTDWEPATFIDLGSTIGSMTTVLKSSLNSLSTLGGVDFARLVRVRRATRREIHLEHEAITETLWL